MWAWRHQPALAHAFPYGALGTFDGRLRWVDADLRGTDWPAKIGELTFDAILSSTALHWLRAEHLVRVYQQAWQLLKPGGALINADHMRYGPRLPAFNMLAEAARERQHAQALAYGNADDWEGWWKALATEPAMQDLLAERAPVSRGVE